MAIRIEQVAAERTFPLRQQVLRPHETIDELALAGDDAPDAGHFVALDGAEVVGTATVRRAAPPWDVEPGPAWRLRGMATSPDRRSSGIGSAVLGAVIDHVGRHGGGLLWCNARTPAIGFYERAGFRVRGDEWDDPLIGPHVAMERTVAAMPRR